MITAADVRGLIDAAVRTVHVAPTLKAYLVDLADATRRHPPLALGMSPRATLRSCAWPGPGRRRRPHYVVPDDLKALAEPVLAHRLLLSADAGCAGSAGQAWSTRSSPRARAHREVAACRPVPAGPSWASARGRCSSAGCSAGSSSTHWASASPPSSARRADGPVPGLHPRCPAARSARPACTWASAHRVELRWPTAAG